MNDKAFKREQMRRLCADALKHMEAAEVAEAGGGFEEQEKEDQLAAIQVTLMSISGREFAETFLGVPMKDEEKKS